MRGWKCWCPCIERRRCTVPSALSKCPQLGAVESQRSSLGSGHPVVLGQAKSHPHDEDGFSLPGSPPTGLCRWGGHSLFPVPYSLFPVPCFLFPIPCSLFPVPAGCPRSLALGDRGLNTAHEKSAPSSVGQQAPNLKAFLIPIPYSLLFTPWLRGRRSRQRTAGPDGDCWQ